MRKALLISLTALICLPLFSLTQKMQIKGYYNSATNGSVDFKITESVTGQNRNLLSSYVNLTDDYTTASKEVFTWTLTGKSRKEVSVTFTFFPLQAYVNGYYYQPAYTITMTKNDTKIGTATTTADNFQLSGGSSFFSKTLENRDGSVYINGFNTENSIKYTGAVASSFPTNSQWIRSGTCKIQITDYEKYIAGTFDYTCNVSVTYTVN